MISLRRRTPSREGPAFRPGAALVGLVLGILLGVAVGTHRGRRGRNVRGFLGEVGRAARDAVAIPGRRPRKKVLAPALDRLRRFRNPTGNGWPG